MLNILKNDQSIFEKSDIIRNYYLLEIYADYSFVIGSNDLYSSKDYIREYYYFLYRMLDKKSDSWEDINFNKENGYLSDEPYKEIKRIKSLIEKILYMKNLPMNILVYNNGPSDGGIMFEYYTKAKIYVPNTSNLKLHKIKDKELFDYLASLNNHIIKNIMSFIYCAKYNASPDLLQKILVQQGLEKIIFSEENIFYLY